MLDNHHHGSPHLAVWLPQPTDAQETLIAADPVRFFRPPYVGPSGWVGVVLDTESDWTMIRAPRPRRLRARRHEKARGAAGAPSRRGRLAPEAIVRLPNR
jgi:hypothetical protein